MSPIDALFGHTLQVRRAAPYSPASVDEWNQPTYEADATVATVRGRIEPMSVTEVALLTDAGAQLGDYRGWCAPADLRISDRIGHDETLCPMPTAVDLATQTFEVRAAETKQAGDGAVHHVELLLRRVVD